jgi:hypothetical protein
MTQVEPELTRIVSHREEVARADTIYRGLYLSRARALLGSAFAETEYRRLQKEQRRSTISSARSARR